MPERDFSADGYRYGFNGKEQDASISSTTDYDYGFRIYNPALGRFLSVDPLTQKYPELTPYQFASNRPIDGIDVDGLEWGPYMPYRLKYFTGGAIKTINTTNTISAVQEIKVIANHSPIFIPGGKLVNLIPDNNTGARIVGAMNGISKVAIQMLDGLENAITKPGQTLKSVFTAPISITDPRLQKGASSEAIEYVNNKSVYGSGYADFNFWTQTTLNAALLIAPGFEGKGVPLRSDAYSKFLEHAFANGRNMDIGLTMEQTARRTFQFVAEKFSDLKPGQNTFTVVINDIQKSITVSLKDGKVQSVNMYPGISKRAASNPVIDAGRLKW